MGDTADEAIRRNSEPRVSALNWGLVYRSRRLWHLALVYFAFGFSYIIYSTFFIRYLAKEGGFTLASAGQLWFRIGLVSILSGFIWGGVSDRWGRKVALLGVFVVQGISFGALGLSRELPVVYGSAALFALSAWSIPALMAALAGDLFGARLAPAALGLMTIVFGFGQALGPFLAGQMADAAHSFGPAFCWPGRWPCSWVAGEPWLAGENHLLPVGASATRYRTPPTSVGADFRTENMAPTDVGGWGIHGKRPVPF